MPAVAETADQPASGAATVTLTGGNVLLTAINTTVTTTTATSSGAGSGSGSVGVGASIALGIGLNSTFAGVENGETVSGTTGNFTVTATSNDTLTTTAKAGAEGATGIGGAIAVAGLLVPICHHAGEALFREWTPIAIASRDAIPIKTSEASPSPLWVRRTSSSARFLLAPTIANHQKGTPMDRDFARVLALVNEMASRLVVVTL